jgi:hypothetical protein
MSSGVGVMALKAEMVLIWGYLGFVWAWLGRAAGNQLDQKRGLARTIFCGTILSRLMLLYRLWNVEESGRKVTLAAFFCVRPKTARLCEGLGKAPNSSI